MTHNSKNLTLTHGPSGRCESRPERPAAPEQKLEKCAPSVSCLVGRLFAKSVSSSSRLDYSDTPHCNPNERSVVQLKNPAAAVPDKSLSGPTKKLIGPFCAHGFSRKLHSSSQCKASSPNPSSARAQASSSGSEASERINPGRVRLSKRLGHKTCSLLASTSLQIFREGSGRSSHITEPTRGGSESPGEAR